MWNRVYENLHLGFARTIKKKLHFYFLLSAFTNWGEHFNNHFTEGQVDSMKSILANPAVLQKLFGVLGSLILTPQFSVALRPLNKRSSTNFV